MGKTYWVIICWIIGHKWLLVKYCTARGRTNLKGRECSRCGKEELKKIKSKGAAINRGRWRKRKRPRKPKSLEEVEG